MGDDEVLAARLAHDARVGAVAVHVVADGPPHAVEDRGAAGEVDPRQVGVGEGHLRHGGGVAGDEVDDPRRESRLLQELHEVVRGQHGAHQGGGDGKVAADGGEVERSHRVDEALEGAVLELVPDGMVRDRLLVVDLLRVPRVEPPEIDQLAGGVDLGLEDRLRLAEHRRRVEGRAPGGGEQLGGLQDDRRAVFPGPRRPFLVRFARGRDRLLDVLAGGLVPLGQNVAVVVRHDGRGGRAAADLLAPDAEGDLDPLRGHGLEPRLQLQPLRRARPVALDRLVDRCGHAPVPREGRCPDAFLFVLAHTGHDSPPVDGRSNGSRSPRRTLRTSRPSAASR